MLNQLEHSLKTQVEMFGSSQAEVDQIKQMLFETSPWLLFVTCIILYYVSYNI